MGSSGSAKLAFLLPDLSWGGAERMTVNIAGGFLNLGLDVDLVVCRRYAHGVAEIAVPSGARVIELGVSKPIRGVPALAGYLSRERPRALIATMTHVCIAGLLATGLAGGGVCICRQVSTITKMFSRSRGVNRWLTPAVAALLFPFGEVVAVSRGVADDLARSLHLNRERVHVIHEPALGADIDARLAAAVQHPWLVDTEVPVFVAAGRLEHVKGFDVLLSAMPRVLDEMDARLVVLGEGSQRASLEARCAALGLSDRVSFPGYVENIPAYMARSAAFVMPSRWEGLGVVLLEALYAGAPVIASDCPHGPREILQDGRFGALVPVDDVVALAGAMKQALIAGRTRRTAELDDWLQRFTPMVAVDEYARIIDAADARSHRRRP